MKKVGLLGGSFNPVHRGHINLGLWLVESGVCDEVWFCLSPLNPLKAGMAPPESDAHRAAMLRLALHETDPRLKPCLAELDMPRPSYTINTLRRLRRQYPQVKFSVVIGTDNWQIFDQWRENESIIREFGVTIYPRPGYALSRPLPPGVTFEADAEVADISSTELRSNPLLRQQWLTPEVNAYIKAHNLYD